MALNIPSSFSVFSPKCPSSNCPRPSTEVRFSRWNNANAQKFVIRERAQKEIEDEIRRHRRFDSATRIVENFDPSTADPNEAPPPPPEIKSIGTPSSPSRPSIPGKKSKYSKIPRDDRTYSRNPRRDKTKISHPAFRPINWVPRVLPGDEKSAINGTSGVPPEDENSGIREHTDDTRNSTHPAFRRVRRVSSVTPEDANFGVALGEHGVSYRIPNAPFEYQYSYTETPKVKPLALREPPFLPFGPSTMPRPWTGRAPIPPSKKKLPEFDSFRLPPPGKKGVKPVQAPGPFLAGSGPKYVKSREEILGEPLTEEEVKELIKGTMKTKRQLHMGKNGLYANLVINVREAFEECELARINCQGMNKSDFKKIGAKLKDLVPCVLISFEREHILMWRGKDWKSSLPILENAESTTEGKNVPLLENECNQAAESMTKGPSACIPENGCNQSTESITEAARVPIPADEFNQAANCTTEGADVLRIPENEFNQAAETTSEGVGISSNSASDYVLIGNEEASDLGTSKSSNLDAFLATPNPNACLSLGGEVLGVNDVPHSETENQPLVAVNGFPHISDGATIGEEAAISPENHIGNDDSVSVNELGYEEPPTLAETSQGLENTRSSKACCTEGVLLLRQQAIETGRALVLDDDSLDANIVFQRAVALAKTAPPGPTFITRARKVVRRTEEKVENEISEVEEAEAFSEKKKSEKSSRPKNRRRKDIEDPLLLNFVPHGSLKVDELAKLLGS
ncbi:CCR4-Not complex caf1 ribonuclease subunit Caf1 [Asimina triloba]